MATPNNNNLQDNGLFKYGTYDSVNKTFNVTATNVKVNGATGFSGTFSLGSTSNNWLITVVNGIITNRA